MQKELINKFGGLGLSQYESHVLLSVYSLGKAKATEISEHSGVPKAKIYGVLDMLCNKRLIRMHATKPLTYSPIDPEKFFDALESWEDEKLNETKKKIEKQKAGTLDELKTLFEKARAPELIKNLLR